MMGTRALVTGANGHIGANLVRELLKRQYEVVPFVRPNSDLRSLAKLKLAYRFGDVRDPDALTQAAEGCELIFHTAAVYRLWAKRAEEILEPAMVGVRNV